LVEPLDLKTVKRGRSTFAVATPHTFWLPIRIGSQTPPVTNVVD